MPGSEINGPSGEQVARLTERLTNAIDDVRGLNTRLDILQNAINEVQLMRRDLANFNSTFETKTTRLFAVTDLHTSQIAKIETAMAINRRGWQVIGTISIALLGGSGALVGWLYNRVENTNRLEYRVDTLENWAQSKTPNLTGPLEVPRSSKGKPQ